MCSKKWAKPDLPASTSLREPVITGICSDTMFGKPVGTTITLSPFASVRSLASKGRMRPAAGAWAEAFTAGVDTASSRATSLESSMALLMIPPGFWAHHTGHAGGNALRRALRAPAARQESRLRRALDPDARARNRSDDGHLQRRVRRA